MIINISNVWNVDYKDMMRRRVGIFIQSYSRRRKKRIELLIVMQKECNDNKK